jgi:hypothetical protein
VFVQIPCPPRVDRDHGAPQVLAHLPMVR